MRIFTYYKNILSASAVLNKFFDQFTSENEHVSVVYDSSYLFDYRLQITGVKTLRL